MLDELDGHSGYNPPEMMEHKEQYFLIDLCTKQMHTDMKKLAVLLAFILVTASHLPAATDSTARVVLFEMNEEVSPSLWVKTQKAFELAHADSADLILLHINTYGGTVVDADSIRTRILNSTIPVVAFIDNNAASAGALIAIACDKIYMRKSASIGAATVVNQSGEAMPDKYQSYMRGIMRATAEAHGCDTLINGTDTTYKWLRNPQIAEAMVDQDICIDGLIEAGKVLTFTTSEAIEHGFCDGLAESIPEVLELAGRPNAVITEYHPTGLDRTLGWLMNPALQGLLIMAIIGGIYFEMQSPGIGFPSVTAVGAAILYFAPLYIEGLAAHWEIALFVLGIILIIIELFAFPGFGVCGISGIVLAVTGLTMAMVGNLDGDVPSISPDDVLKSLLLVIISSSVSIGLCLWISSKFYTATIFGNRLSLTATQKTDEGFVAVSPDLKQFIGQTAIAETVLRPSGKIIIDKHVIDAKSVYGFIEKGTKVEIVGCETGQLYVKPTSN